MLQCFIESFKIAGNLLRGTIPQEFLACWKLSAIDLSRNNFVGAIPIHIKNLFELNDIRMNGNSLTGSIPTELFNLSKIEYLALQSNKLTGSIPTEIGLLKNAKIITLNHNELKGDIPLEFSNISSNLETLHLHFNKLTGSAPSMAFENRTDTTFIADCGDPLFHLINELSCDDCTMCCNSLNACQKRGQLKLTKLQISLCIGLAIPAVVGLFFWFSFEIKRLFSFDCFPKAKNRHSLYNHDSVYCFIFSPNWIPIIVYLLTAGLQMSLYIIYILSSSFGKQDNDWIFSFRCPDNDMTCTDERTADPFGWFLFYVVLALNLGPDMVLFSIQLHRGALMGDATLSLSGFMLAFLTVMGIVTSAFYNQALAEKNTDLITNAVILLFINELDERALTFVAHLAPEWTSNHLIDIRNIVAKKANIKAKEEESNTSNSIQDPNSFELE